MLIENKAMDSKLKSSIGEVVCKLDIEKTYKHIVRISEKLNSSPRSQGCMHLILLEI